MSWQIDLGGQAGIVTGAGSGIGRETAQHLARMGARLVLADINQEGLTACIQAIGDEDGSRILAVPTDVSDKQQVDRLAAACIDAFGAIDFLVNGHGILRRSTFLSMAIDEWDQVLNVNLRACFLLCRAVLPHMKARGRGAIVNVASLAGRSCSVLGGAHYTTAKHGLIGLSRHLAREFGPFGIRVNAFCPGATLTPMTENASSPEEIERVAAAIPIGRWGKPEEQARVIGFLISNEAAYITGASIDSNGGALMV